MSHVPQSLKRYDFVLDIVRANLRQLRLDRGVFQEDIACELGLSQAAYSRLEGSKNTSNARCREITIREAFALCAYYGVSMDVLFDGVMEYKCSSPDQTAIAAVEAAKVIIYSQMQALKEAQARIDMLEAELETADV